MKASAVFAAIDRHWFSPIAVRDLGIVRWVLVLTQLVLFYPSLSRQLWMLGLPVEQFTPLPAANALFAPFIGWGERPDPDLIRFLFVVGIGTGITSLIGLWTRPSLFVFAFINAALIAHGYSYGEVHHAEAIVVLSLFVLAVSRSGEAISIDALLARLRAARVAQRFLPRGETPETSLWALWPLRTLQWLLAFIYLSAGWFKLHNGGLEWFNGYSLIYYVTKDTIERDTLLGAAMTHWPVWIFSVISVLVVLVELGFILAPLSGRLAWILILVAAPMHVAIYFAQKAPFFEFLCMYIVFLPDLRAAWPWRRRERETASESRWTLIFDGLCPLCIRSMTVIDALAPRGKLRYLDFEGDWDGARELVPGLTRASAREEMRLVSPQGEVFAGFHAFRRLSRVLPALWVLVPLLHLPFAEAIGTRVYKHVAGTRERICRHEVCEI